MSRLVAGKSVNLTAHCRERMRLRKVSEDEICEALEIAGSSYPGKQGRLHIQSTLQGGRLIRVTVEDGDGYYNVVTVVVLDDPKAENEACLNFVS